MPAQLSQNRRDVRVALAVALACVAGFAVVLWPLWQSATRVLAFNDGNIEIVLSPVFAYPESITRIWDDHFYFGRGDVGFGIAGFSALESALGPYGYRRVGPLFITALLGLAGFWLARQLRRSRTASAVVGLFLGLCGWTLTSTLAGLFGRPLALLWAALALGLIERAEAVDAQRAAPRRALTIALAGGALGLAIAETADVGAFLALSLAAWWLLGPRPPRARLRHWRRYALLFLVLVSASALVSSHTLVKMAGTELAAGLDVEQTEEAAWDWATQWSYPASESLALAVPGLFGSSSRSETAPYWGGLGRTPGHPEAGGWRHFKLSGYYFGTAVAVMLATLAVGLGRRRFQWSTGDRRRAWVALGLLLISVMLAWGRHFVAYGVFHSLPFMGTIRNPEKWLGPAVLFAAVALGYAVDALLEHIEAPDADGHGFGRAFDAGCLLAAVGLVLLSGAVFPADSGLQPAQLLAAAGAGERAVLGALLVLLGLVAARRLAAWLSIKGLSPSVRRLAFGGPLALLVAAQLLVAARPYVEIHDSAYLGDPSPVVEALDRLEHGRIKLLPSRDAVLNNWRQTYFASRATPLFDPISVRALPGEEARFFAAVGQRPLDLWRLGAVRYFFATRPAVDELAALPDAADDFYVIETRTAADWDPRLTDPVHRISRTLGRRGEEAISLLELRSARPALRLLPTWTPVDDGEAGDRAVREAFADPNFDIPSARFIHGAPPPPAVPRESRDRDGALEVISRTPTRVEARVTGPGMLLRASRFDPRWRVSIDGEGAPLLRANSIFQAVQVGDGEHRVVFEFAPPQGLFALSVAGRLALLMLAVAVFRRPSEATP
ncbi:MAG: hypothetical protein AAGM22_20915 [Acidobacteriota bacterium]